MTSGGRLGTRLVGWIARNRIRDRTPGGCGQLAGSEQHHGCSALQLSVEGNCVCGRSEHPITDQCQHQGSRRVVYSFGYRRGRFNLGTSLGGETRPGLPATIVLVSNRIIYDRSHSCDWLQEVVRRCFWLLVSKTAMMKIQLLLRTWMVQ